MIDRSNSAELKAFDVQMRRDLRVRLRDGDRLSATLYVPQGQKAAPAIFVLTPYIHQVHHDQGVYFASCGYPFLTVDVRGRGDSDGEFHPINEAGTDPCDVVEWVARQPWCNGNVGMWGGSYSGYVQWIAAKECPPSLCAIVPVAAPYRGVDGPARNNIFAPYRIQWLTHLSGRAAQDKMFADREFWSRQFKRWLEAGVPFKTLDTFVGSPSKIFREWVSYPECGPYWDRYNPTSEQYSKISIPILTITGAYDSNQLGALTHYREHMKHASPQARARHYLIIGPWDHAGTRLPKREFGGVRTGPASLLDVPKLHREWYAWTMQDGPKPEFLKKNVAYFATGAEEWHYANSLEGITARSEPFFLQSSGNPTDLYHSGTLGPDPPVQSEPDCYIYDPRDVSHAELESIVDPTSLTDQRLAHARTGKHLVYHSVPFEERTEISGFFRLLVWLAIDQPDTDFQVAVHEIGIDGGSILLSNDVLRARYREGSREAKLIRTREPLRYDFERFTFVSRRIEQGHRLRLTFGPINSIFSQKNYNSGGIVSEESITDSRTVTVKLFHDEARPSALYVPFGHADGRA